MGMVVESTFFTLQIEHNGIFCGPSSNLEYASASVEILDYCFAANFSYSFIEKHMQWLSYPVWEHHIYWCRPGCLLSEGLVPIRGDVDVQYMITASAVHKVLEILIDHSDFIQICRHDVIYTMPSSVSRSLVEIILSEQAASGSQHMEVSVQAAETSSANLQIAVSEQAETVGELTDSNFSDSDFSIDEGDDDLFDEYIDFCVDEEEPEEIDDEPEYVLEDEDLDLSREEEDNLKYKFSAFNAKVDMDSPIFRVGMVFADVKQLRQALNAYSIRNRVEIKKVKNEKTRLEAVCKPGCHGFLKLDWTI